MLLIIRLRFSFLFRPTGTISMLLLLELLLLFCTLILLELSLLSLLLLLLFRLLSLVFEAMLAAMLVAARTKLRKVQALQHGSLYSTHSWQMLTIIYLQYLQYFNLLFTFC